MKKYTFLILFISFLFSCSNDNPDIFIDESSNKSDLESIKVESEETRNKHIEQFYKQILVKNPDSFKYENPNSNLFVDEDNLTKSSSQTLYAQGYDSKNILDKFSLTFGFPRAGLIQGVPYYAELCEYIKYVEIPKGYSFAIPPSKPPIMSTNIKSIYDSNMGYIPNTSSFHIGYSVKYISTYGNKDKYAFITHVEEISKRDCPKFWELSKILCKHQLQD